MCLAVTQRLALPAFDHLIIACFLSLFTCLLMISPFILSVAKCNAVFHYSPVCFAGLGSDIMPLLLHAGTNTRGMGSPFQVHAHPTLFTCLICHLRCVGLSFLARVMCSQEWQDGKCVARMLSACHLHRAVLFPSWQDG